ncbi:MAG TPA: glycosyltransferase family 4 protein [Burkholderiales bacterium]|nr:glycosyltransferase family 4 protein [Burkholderiales bacterium]
MTKRKIVLFSPSLDAVSGVSTHVRMLFASDLARDYELLHFQVGSEGRRENALQKLMRFTLSPLHLALFLLRTGVDVVHINASLDLKAYWRDLAYSIVARLLGRRVVNQIHGGAMPQDFFRGNAFLTWVLRRFLVSSDVVTVLSGAELAAYRAFDARIKVHLVPNAIDPVGLADQPRSYNTDRPLSLVYVGRLVRTKGLFELIEALKQLKRAGREFRFSIAGGGPDQAELIAATERADLKDRVQFLGSVFAAEKCRLWLESDLFVLPTYTEGLPYSLLEAMAAGCVPIATSVAAIPDVMRDGEHGLLVPVKNPGALASAVAALDDDREGLVRMARAARRRVIEQYTVARLADDFHKLYDGCLA